MIKQFNKIKLSTFCILAGMIFFNFAFESKVFAKTKNTEQEETLKEELVQTDSVEPVLSNNVEPVPSDIAELTEEELNKKDTKESLKEKETKKSKKKKKKEEDESQTLEIVEAEPMPPSITRKPLSLDGVDHPLTVKYRERYLTGQDKKWIIQALNRSVPFRPYIRQQLKERNLPMELQYLPIVESYYNVNAVSYAKAVGIWQFMENSMHPYMKKNSWYDERKDPWKATNAALSKLEENYKLFGNWEIAIAAYNCGNGAMSKVVKKNKDKDFWYLAENNLLKTQTAQYIPKLLAIADIIENAEYYNVLDILEADNEIKDVEVQDFDYITTEGMYSFSQIAQVSGIEEETIKLLNPELLRNCTPARQAYSLRLPKNSDPDIEEKLKESGTATDAVIYTVEQGDTLWGISRKYGLTVEDLCQINNIKEKAILKIKQKLIVPIFD